jgi:hypothetical protein
MRRLGPIALGLSEARTFLGRSSVELAWRAPAEIEGGDEFTPESLRLFSEGIAIGLSRYARHNHGRPSPIALRARKRIAPRICHDCSDASSASRPLTT